MSLHTEGHRRAANDMSTYPHVQWENGQLEVAISSDVAPKSVIVRVVLDFDRFGDIVGIEILNLKDQVGNRCLRKIEEVLESPVHGLRYSYYDDTDSFYLYLSEAEDCPIQKAVDGELVLNDTGQSVGFRIDAQAGR